MSAGDAWTGLNWHGTVSVVVLLVYARLGLLLNLTSLAVATLHTFSVCMVFLQERHYV